MNKLVIYMKNFLTSDVIVRMGKKTYVLPCYDKLTYSFGAIAFCSATAISLTFFPAFSLLGIGTFVAAACIGSSESAMIGAISGMYCAQNKNDAKKYKTYLCFQSINFVSATSATAICSILISTSALSSVPTLAIFAASILAYVCFQKISTRLVFNNAEKLGIYDRSTIFELLSQDYLKVIDMWQSFGVAITKGENVQLL